jgi:hypothetical protein
LRLLHNYEVHFKLRQRKRKLRDQEVFEATVEGLLADAAYAYLLDPGCGLMLSLANDHLGAANRYKAPIITKALPDILSRLSSPEMAYLDVQKGHQGFPTEQGRRTTIRAGSRLVDRISRCSVSLDDFTRLPHGEVILLKAPKQDRRDSGRLLQYEDTDQTNAFRAEMRTINQWLAEADIDFDEAWADMPVDDHRRELRRVFNDGRFNAGGRLFGGFWQDLKKEQRARGLLLAGQPVVTLDYRQMGPRMMYGMVGAVPPSDCYAVPRYELFRDGWKRLFGALTHVGPELGRFPQGTRSLFPAHLRVGEAIRALLDFHAPVADRFVPGAGLDLMFTESEIIVDVLLSARRERIVALPIHDAVVVAHGHRDTMARIMVQAFKDHVGILGEVATELVPC